jgi:hypothetical protein
MRRRGRATAEMMQAHFQFMGDILRVRDGRAEAAGLLL